MYGLNILLESKQSELYHDKNQWACQVQMENFRMFEELITKSRLYQENHASDCTELEELRRICHEEKERARQFRTDQLHAQKRQKNLLRLSSFNLRSGLCKTR